MKRVLNKKHYKTTYNPKVYKEQAFRISMANEAILRTRLADPVNFTCNDDHAMEKGSIVFLSGARTVWLTAGDGNQVIGITAREKIAGDGRTSVPVYLDGIFDCVVIDAVTIGSQVGVSGANILKVFTAGDSEDGTTLGNVLETCAAGTQTVQVWLNK